MGAVGILFVQFDLSNYLGVCDHLLVVHSNAVILNDEEGVGYRGEMAGTIGGGTHDLKQAYLFVVVIHFPYFGVLGMRPEVEVLQRLPRFDVEDR